MLLLLVLAPVVGSFLGVLVRRLPLGRSVVSGRSACESCGHALGPQDLVPILSFLWLRGRCRHCGAPIAQVHLWIELASLVVAAAVTTATGDDPALGAAGCVLGWTLLVLAWIDARSMLLPDVLTLPLVLAGLLATLALDPDALADHAAAAALGFGLFATVAALYRRHRGQDGLGGGDAKLMAAAGAWLGLAGLAPAMLGGAVLGLLYAGLLRLLGRTLARDARIPFGPFLALAIGAVWLLDAAGP